MKKLTLTALLLIPLTLGACSNGQQKSSSDHSAKTEQVSSKTSDKSSESKKEASSSKTSSSQNSDKVKNMSREELTAAEKKNNNQPLDGESIKNNDAAIALLNEKYGKHDWKVEYNSIGKESPIYFHVTSKNNGQYYVYANGEIQNAGGDLSDAKIDK